jgi:hypothetical protein
MLAIAAAGVWMTVLVVVAIVLTGLYIFGMKREERHHEAEHDHPFGPTDEDVPR